MVKPVILTESGRKKEKWLYMGLFALVAFLGLFVFYSAIHPLYVFDLDDWLYSYYGRHAVPDMTEWNPTKVLPETWMPLLAYIGAFFIYPVQGDYIQSLCYVFAFTTAAFIVGYVLAAVWVIRKRFQTGEGALVVLAAIFLLGHFMPFLIKDTGNLHLFHARDVTCIFNYTIPALLNFILCCYFLVGKEGQWWDNSNLFRKALLVLAVYLAIHSNLLSNIILMALFGIQLLLALLEGIWQNKKNQQKWMSWKFLKEYIWYQLPKITAILCWLISMIFEISGKRSSATDAGLNLYGAVHRFIESIQALNTSFLVFVAAINLVAIGVAGYRFYKKHETQFLYWQTEMAACMGLTIVYLILVTAKVDADYILRSDVMISWMVFLMFMTLSAMAYLLKEIPKMVLLLPLLLYILFFETVTAYSTFADPFISEEGGAVVKAVCDDMIEQVCQAEKAGLTEVEVFIPASMADGWPLDVKMTGDRLPKALYHHNLIERRISVTIVPDPAKDAQFMIPK